MNFALTEDQQMIRDAAEGFLAEASGSAAVRAAMDGDAGIDRTLWQGMADLGWCGTHIAEAHGGLGLGVVELVLLLEQMGRRLPCVPFFSSVCLAGTALQQAGSDTARARWLPRIADGSLQATLALSARGVQWDATMPGATARRAAAGWQLDGSFAHVPDGASAELIFVVARLADTDEIGLFAVPSSTPGLQRAPLRTWDATRRLAEVALNGVQLGDGDRVDGGAEVPAALQRSAAIAALLLAAEQLGGAQQCLALTLAYTAQRSQFGQPVAAFQAVKHRCAEMMVRIEATRSAVYGAAALAAEATALEPLVLEAGAAKAQASEAFFFCAQEAIQLHGGVGFTWEYDPHLYFKRAQAGAHWLGTPQQWRERIAAALLD
ncbi:MAG TPA: acyl-CoA dehydrogenase family protein [Ramlibacter sp.]|nr:acyl-CoA dehydrogenase family protein [Ramlibacter sp.]